MWQIVEMQVAWVKNCIVANGTILWKCGGKSAEESLVAIRTRAGGKGRRKSAAMHTHTQELWDVHAASMVTEHQQHQQNTQ